MSILTSAGLKTWPSAADAISVTSGASSGALGDWVEIIPADSISSPIAIGGLCAQLYSGLTNGGGIFEIQLGTGESLSESVIGKPLLVSAGGGNQALEIWMLPIPIANIAANARLSMRLRADAIDTTYAFALMYYDSIEIDFAMMSPYTYAPYSDGTNMNGAQVTPNSSAWANSAWVSFDASIGVHSEIIGVAAQYPGSAYDGLPYEIELGLGDPGSEVGITTLRGVFSNAGPQGFMNLWLPAMYPIDTGTAISYRLRKAGTSVEPLDVYLLYIEDIITPPPPATTTYQTVRERIFPLPFESNLMLFLERIEFLIQAGEGLVTGQGSDPVVAVWFSKDGGKTYGNGYTVRPGKMGEYDKRAYLNRLGRARNWVCKIRVSDPVFWAFLDCYVDMSEGTS